MQNSISHWQRILLQEIEEKDLSPKQQNIAALRAPKDKIGPNDLEALRSGAKIDEEGMDHEVSMANNSIESIIKAAMELKAKLGDDEKDIPAWIQDHITNAANFISQAADNYHEYGDHEAEEETEDSLTSITENDFSLDDFEKKLHQYEKGDIDGDQVIKSYNKLSSLADQDEAKKLAKSIIVKSVNVIPIPKKISEMSLQKMMEKINRNGHK